MNEALNMAKQAILVDEVPIGALLVNNNKIIAKDFNRTIINNDPTAHAEILVLRSAATKLNNYRLINCTLYVTLEPCAMCVSAAIHARVKKIVFATKDKKTGMLGGCKNIFDMNCFNHKIKIEKGILKEQSSELLTSFFKNKRKNNATKYS